MSRQTSRLSQAELARRLGWDRGRVHKYENNEIAVSVPLLERVAEVLGLRSEAVVLFCLKQRYPKLDNSAVGRLLDALLEQTAAEDRQSQPSPPRQG